MGDALGKKDRDLAIQGQASKNLRFLFYPNRKSLGDKGLGLLAN